jgi:hypothetical protein
VVRLQFPFDGDRSFFGTPAPSRYVTAQGSKADKWTLRAHIIQQCMVTPWRLGHQMVEGLPCSLDIVRTESCRHRLDALSLPRQQQAFAAVLQGSVSIFMSRRNRQALYMPRNASLVGPARKGVKPQNNSKLKVSVCDPVVLGRSKIRQIIYLAVAVGKLVDLHAHVVHHHQM